MSQVRLIAMSCVFAATVATGVGAASEKRLTTVKVGDISLDFAYIPPGEFEMGGSRGSAVALAALNFEAAKGGNEGPVRRVKITRGFYLGRYQITCKQFCEFLNATDRAKEYVNLNHFAAIELVDGKYRPKADREQSAVNVVEWNGAVAFCDWLSQKTGDKFRLPTEAEWEFAARGKEGRKYPGNETPEGVAGMGAGSAYDWCHDYYGVRYLPEDTIDPQGPTKKQLPIKSDNPLIGTPEGEYRVLRGRAPVATRRFLGDKVGADGVYGLRIVMETKNGKR
jgi:formylglycine-generating enzyme required for sulfatase activity